MNEKLLEITNEDLLLEIGKLYVQNVYKDKIILDMRAKLENKNEEQE